MEEPDDLREGTGGLSWEEAEDGERDIEGVAVGSGGCRPSAAAPCSAMEICSGGTNQVAR